MHNEPLLIRKSKKLYVATLEFISGEYGQIFEKAFYAINSNDIEKQIHNYLSEYYGMENVPEVEGDIYYYFNGEVAVKKHGWEEVADLKQVINKLLN